MSVLIKGMEMPKSCSVCPLLGGDRMDGLCHAASKWLDDDEYWTWYVYPEGEIDDSKPCNCPLIPVPSHGRLIDADRLIQNKGIDTYSAVFAVASAPTVIEAEEDE